MIVLHGIVKSKALVCLVFFHLLLVLARENYTFEASATEKRSKRDSVEEDEQILKINRQITVFLSAKESKEFRFLDIENQDHNLSVTVTPCSTTIKWSFVYHTDEVKKQSAAELLENGRNVGNYEIDQLKTVTVERAKKGWYCVILKSLVEDSRVSIYVTMDGGGPYELTVPQISNPMLIPQRRQRLKVTWEPSLINPQITSYCLVVSTKKEYSSLCGAEEEGLKVLVKGTEVPVIVNLSNLKLERKKKKGKFYRIESGTKGNNDTVIICSDRKTQLTLTKMKNGVKYFFNLFSINNNTNLTVPYGKSFIRYNFTVKPIVLRDGIQKIVDLKKMEGKASFRFKAYNTTDELDLYVLACGGAVNVEFKVKGLDRRRGKKAKENANSLPKPTRVFGFKRFRILYPEEGEQYYLKVNAPNVDELARINYIEVFATLYPGQRYPLPLLPEDSNVHEFKSQKTCNSVTIGWIPVQDSFVNTYCVLVWENRKHNYADWFRGNFQCNLDKIPRRRSSLTSPNEFSVWNECEDMITENRKSVTSFKIKDLKPGMSYTIQVTVKKKKGRTLSYKFLKVYTKHACNFQ